jgi:hypothetical protein
MTRAITVKNLYERKYKILEVDGIWKEVLGEPEANGAWLIYGKEKNGKTWIALQLAWYLSRTNKVLYVSAEEGTGKAFKESLQRVGVKPDCRSLHILEYESVEELDNRLGKQRAPNIVFIDNLTIYQDEFKRAKDLSQLISKHDTKLFVFLAHEERGDPYTSAAKLCRKLAKVIFHVKGLACNVTGRVPGGVLVIDEGKSQLFHGNQTENESSENQGNQKILPAQAAEGNLQGRGKKKNSSRSLGRAAEEN